MSTAEAMIALFGVLNVVGLGAIWNRLGMLTQGHQDHERRITNLEPKRT